MISIGTGSLPNDGHQNPKEARGKHSLDPLTSPTSAFDACLSLNRVYNTAMDWTQETIDDDEVRIACEGVQTVCHSILSTVDELLSGDTGFV